MRFPLADMLGFLASVAILAAYHAFLRARLRDDPRYTVQAVITAVRVRWVEQVMATRDHGILAVQTLRNSIMGATFLASTAILLVIGTLTLSGQGDNLHRTWQSLDALATPERDVWMVKLLLLLLDFIVAFFSFCMSIRLMHHVGYMIGDTGAGGDVSATYAATTLNRAGAYYAAGMRAYYFSEIGRAHV